MLVVAIIAINVIPANAQGSMNKSMYMNTAYCHGVAEEYHERLSSSGSAFSSDARSSRRVARALRERAAGLASRFDIAESEGVSAKNHGASVMSGMLPAGGSWANSGTIPIEAVRQYEQCRSIVE